MQARSPIGGKTFGIATIAMLAALAVAALTLAFQTAPAFADESSSSAAAEPSDSSASEQSASADSASPASASSSSASAEKLPYDVSTLIGLLPLMGNDYVWFGNNLDLSQATIKNDLIAAGQTVLVTDCVAEGSIRAAAKDITVTNSTARENITVAAQNVTIKNGTANAVAMAGSAVSFSGTCNELTAFAETVFIDGTVEGDVVIGAKSVEIATNARIKGTLYVSAASDPVMQRGAEVANVEFTQSDSSASSANVESAIAGFSSMMFVMMAIVGAICTLLIAVLAEWLFRRQTAGAAEMIRTRTGATIGTGIIAALVAPIVIIVLLCLVITAPISLALTLALLAMTCVADGFAGASLFKLAFPRLGRYKCALAGGAIMGVASAIPILGNIVNAAAFMYLLGYVLQSIFLGIRKNAPAPTGPIPAYAAPANPTQGYAPYAAPANQAPIAPATAPAASAAPEAPIAPATASTPDAPAPGPDATPMQ